MSDSRKDFLNTEELSALIGVKEKTLYAWAFQKKIPHYKAGRLTLFRYTEILEWLESRKVEIRA